MEVYGKFCFILNNNIFWLPAE